MKKRNDKCPTVNCRFLRFIFTAVLLMSFVKVILSNTIANNGTIIKKVSEKIDIVNESNQQLKEEITQLGSINRISQEAQKSGFVSTSAIVNISTEIPIALR